jgi:hypothetical protein
MTAYQDDTVLLDEAAVTIQNYWRPGGSKRIAYTEIKDLERFEMGFWSGRHRLVGISLGRPRNWFPWDSTRNGKTSAISLDVGGLLHPTIVPDDPEVVEEILRGAIQ